MVEKKKYTTQLTVALGNRIRNRRADIPWTYDESRFASAIGCTLEEVQDVERGVGPITSLPWTKAFDYLDICPEVAVAIILKRWFEDALEPVARDIESRAKTVV